MFKKPPQSRNVFAREESRLFRNRRRRKVRDFFIIFVLGIFFGNAFIVAVKVVLVDVRKVAARRPADVRRQALVEIQMDVGLSFLVFPSCYECRFEYV